MADDLRADLDELLLQTRQRPILDRLRRRQSAQEIAEIVGQRMKLETDGVRGERPTSVIVRRGLLGANRPSELRESYLDEVAAIHGEAA